MRQRLEAGRIWGRGIEWEAALDVLAQEARTAMGRERAVTAQPLTDPERMRSAIDTTGQARRALGAAGSPPFDVIPDIRPILDRARTPGSVLEGVELVQIAPVLEASPRLAAYGRGVADVAPAIGRLTDALPRVPALRDALRRALDDEGAMTDQASPRLGHLRRAIRDRRRRIVGELERLLQASDAVADRFVTVRHGRYVIPVRADARARVRGIVHDRSQSGQTIFVEPDAVIEANNELVEMARAEEQEIQRILAELTDRVRERIDDLASLVEAIGELDWIFCRAHSAERMRATAPLIDVDQTVSLRAARHPLLLAQSWKEPSRPVVPVDLELSRQRPLAPRDRPQRRRQDHRPQDARALRPHGAGGLSRAGGRGLTASRLRRGVRHRRGRSERRQPPLDVLGLRHAGPRNPDARRRGLPRAPRRARSGDRPRRGRGPRPGHPGRAGDARRPGDGHHAPRAAEGVREHPSRRPQRLRGVRQRHPDSDVPAPLRPPRPELRALHRRALRAGPGAPGARPRPPVGPGRAHVRVARAPRCPGPVGSRADHRARAARARGRGAARSRTARGDDRRGPSAHHRRARQAGRRGARRRSSAARSPPNGSDSRRASGAARRSSRAASGWPRPPRDWLR